VIGNGSCAGLTPMTFPIENRCLGKRASSTSARHKGRKGRKERRRRFATRRRKGRRTNQRSTFNAERPIAPAASTRRVACSQCCTWLSSEAGAGIRIHHEDTKAAGRGCLVGMGAEGCTRSRPLGSASGFPLRGTASRRSQRLGLAGRASAGVSGLSSRSREQRCNGYHSPKKKQRCLGKPVDGTFILIGTFNG